MHDKSLSITPNSVHCDAITSTDMNIENVTFSLFCPGHHPNHLRAIARDLVPVLGKPAQMTFILLRLASECSSRFIHVCVSTFYTALNLFSASYICLAICNSINTVDLDLFQLITRSVGKGWKLVSVSQYLKAAAPLYVYIVYTQ